MDAKFKMVSKLSKRKFKRYTGVYPDVFEVMSLVVSKSEQEEKVKSGRPSNLSIEDQILMTLTYYREYRTFFHLGIDYGIDESNAQRTVERIESILLKSGYFNLPGKKVLISAKEIETLLVDATEMPASRPKKKSVEAVK